MDSDASKLKDIIDRHGGYTMVEDRARCEAILRDLWGSDRGQLNLLLMALEEGVATRLSSSSGAGPTNSLVRQLISSLVSDRHLQESGAHWAVETWALALGRISARTRVSQSARSNRRPTRSSSSSPPSSGSLPARPTSAGGLRLSRVLRFAAVGVVAIAAVLVLRQVIPGDPAPPFEPEEALRDHEKILFASFDQALTQGDLTRAQEEFGRLQSEIEAGGEIGDRDRSVLRKELLDRRSRLERLKVNQVDVVEVDPEYDRVAGEVNRLVGQRKYEQARALVNLRLDADSLNPELRQKLLRLRDSIPASR